MEDEILGLAQDDGALARVKEMKIKLPLRHHMKLHSLKLIHGKGISDAISEALDLYFTDPPGAAGADAKSAPEPESASVEKA